MKDSVILGTGTSKLLKSGNVPNNFADFRTALLNGTLPVDITTDSAGYSQVGTALNKANLLSDQAAIDVWQNTNVPSNPVLSDAFQKLADRGSTLETNVSAIQTLLGDTAMTSDMGTVSDSVFRHDKELVGWIPDLPVTNIDQFPQNNINGTFWLNVLAQAVSGTMPVSTGQGLLICKRQTTTYWRQVFIGITGASARKFRYYVSNTATWTAWADWDDDVEAVPSFTPASGVTNGLFIRKSGRIVTINGYCSGVNFSGANVATTLGTLSDYYPQYTIRALCSIGANAYSVGTLGYIAVDPDGLITVKSSAAASSRNVYFSIAYIWHTRA